jgi:SH3-like domain-containing protein
MTACGNKNNDEPKDPDTEQPGTTDPSVFTFTTVEERTRANVTVEIRLDPSMDVDNVIGSLRVGEIVTRTGISADGTWSRIHMTPAGFDEGDYYVSSNCLEIYTGPEQPEQPENPEDPTDPENPDVTDPENPTTDPEDPENPENPEDPAEPEVPSFTAVEAYTWANPYINLREQATSTSRVVTTLSFGSKVQCVAKQGAWIEVIYGEYSGFVHSSYLTLRDPNPSDFTAYTEPKSMVVNTEALYVRYYPFSEDINGEIISSEDSIFGFLSKGDAVTVTGASADNKWASIQRMDGQTYYVYAKYLSGFTGGTTTPSTPGTQTPAVTFTTIVPTIMYPSSRNVRYYSEADVLTAPVGVLSMSDTVKCIAMSNDGIWFKVNLSETNTTPYYIMQKDLQSNGK